MKSTKLLFAAALLVLANACFADTYSVFDMTKNSGGSYYIYGYPGYRYLSAGSYTYSSSYSGTWKLANDPAFTSTSLAGSTITSITMDFWFADDGDADTGRDHHGNIVSIPGNEEWVKISAGGNTGTTDAITPQAGVEVDGRVYIGNISNSTYFNSFLSGGGYYEEISYTFTLSDSIFNDLAADLQQDGILNYIVKALKGDTYLKESRITVVTRDQTVSVPDGGSTAALDGAGLLGVAAAYWRKKHPVAWVARFR